MKKTLKKCSLGLCFLYCMQAFADHNLTQWVSMNTEVQHVLFYQNQYKQAYLYGLELIFQHGNIAYSYKVTSQIPLIIAEDQMFSFTPQGLYNIAKHVIPADDLQKVEFIQIRLIKSNQEYVIFSEGCSDQDINCTLPIHCHPSVENCEFDYADLRQKVIF